MKARSVLRAALVFFVATPALAADWVLVERSADQQDTSYVDKSSIIASGSIRRYWARTDFISNPDGWQRVLALWENNCATGENRLLQATVYKVDGSNNSVPTSGAQWQYVTPETVEDSIHKYICKGES
ncbi:MAG: hypothetical protein IPG62_16375 [Sphingomonadales bacterium]|nr:hypothetical protein [Sphingomonadales bacterium]